MGARFEGPAEEPPKPGCGFSRLLVLKILLGQLIVVFATMPMLLHHQHSIGKGASTPSNPLLRPPPSSRQMGKRATLETAQLKAGDTVYNFAFEDEHTSNVTLPEDIGAAGRALLLNALEERPVWDKEGLDDQYEKERCSKYFSWENQQKNRTDYKARRRRRVFLGSLIADDSWHAIGAIAMEVYGIYTAAVFVESNRTQTGTPRKLRFEQGSTAHNILVERNLFGPDTRIILDQFSFEGKVHGKGLIREQMQRSRIIELWKEAGMTEHDVGVITDADETPTRDFLRAVQSCDFPQLDPELQNCAKAKVIVASMVFEGSPECMTTTRKWMHPDLILGKCIDGIGDARYSLKDSQRQSRLAWRQKRFTAKFNYSGWPKEMKTFPLWNAADFRRDQAGHTIIFEDVDYLPFRMGHTGYHFHNYFKTTEQLRHKYQTYGHPVENATQLGVGEIHPDLDLMVDCVLGRSYDNNKHKTLSARLEEFEGRIPIAYGIEGYTMARHLELKSLLLSDEIGHERSWHTPSRL